MKFTIKKINEDLLHIMNQLRSKIKGRLTYHNEKTQDYKEFNSEMEKLINSYSIVLNSLNYNKQFFTINGNLLYSNAFKDLNIEKHVFSFQIDLLINQFDLLIDKINKDYIVLKNSILVESLEGYFQLLLNTESDHLLYDYTSLKDSLGKMKTFLKNFYNDNLLTIPFSDNNSNPQNILLKNKFISIQYNLNELNESLNKRIYEIEKDFLILQNIK